MKQSEAVQCRARFKCMRTGCNVAQRWLSLCRHMTIFHHTTHADIDAWRDTLTIEDSAGVTWVTRHKRTVDGPKVKRQAPPPPAPTLAPERKPLNGYNPPLKMPLGGYHLGSIARITNL